MINNEKSDFNAKTKGKCVGTIIGTRELIFTVLQEKIVTMYLNQEFLTSKQLSKAAGQLSSTHLVVGPLVRRFTGNMYHFVENRVS